MTRVDEHVETYIPALGNLTCCCGWAVTEFDAAKADAAMMRHLRDEGVIV